MDIKFYKIFFLAVFFVLLPLFIFGEDLASLCKEVAETENYCSDLNASDCRSVLEKCAAYYDEQSTEIAQDLNKTQQQKNTLQGEVSSLKKKVQNLEYQINQGTLIVKDLNIQIKDTQTSIGKTDVKIIDAQEQIANILRTIYTEDKKSPLVILMEGNLSDYFSNLAYLENLNSKVSNLLETTTDLKSYLQKQREKMDAESDKLQKTIALQSQQKVENEQNRKQQEAYLKVTEAQYQQQLAEKQAVDQISAKIRAQLFQVVGVPDAPTFGDALELAKSIGLVTGIRPAFLLAIISQESAIGRNVGQCNIADTTSGASVSIKTGKRFTNGIHKTRDLPPFLIITSELGRDPLKTPISCAIPNVVGYGGAMGPAQFIPSTWMLFKDKLSSLLNKYPDPWAIKDAFSASALYLAQLGATAQTSAKESNAASRYYGGSSSYARSVMNRAACIQTFIDTGTMSTYCENLILPK